MIKKHSIKNNAKIIAGLFLAGFTFLGSLQAVTVVDPSQIPTGYMEINSFKYPVYLYVPEMYKPTQPYPLLIVMEGYTSPQKTVEQWMNFAKRKSMIVLSLGLDVSLTREVPLNADQFLFRVKDEVSRRYKIASDRTYLVGRGEGAHYASYLGVNYPEQFSGVALLDGAWVGPLEKALRISDNPNKQIPFFVSFHQSENNQALLAAEEKSAVLAQKGYPVYFEKVDAKEDFGLMDFRKRMLTWLDDKSESWNRVVAENKKTIKQKIKSWYKDFTSVK